MFNFFKTKMTVWIVSDGTDSMVQSRQLAKNITSDNNILEFNRLGANSYSGNYPDLAIGVGYNVTDTLLGIKARSNGKTKIAIILDPLKNHDDFDFIILPSYEPYNVKSDNVIYTTGLINFVNDDFIKAVKESKQTKTFLKELKKSGLKPPYTALFIGGNHTGGNISVNDAEIIANEVNRLVNEKGGTLLISNSKRTEIPTTDKLKELLHHPNYFYDYQMRSVDNLYNVFVAISDEIIVTGDSVRMMSEAVSSGKKVRIYKPVELGFQYDSLIKEFYKGGFAVSIKGENISNLHTLNEAKRVADIILEKLESQK